MTIVAYLLGLVTGFMLWHYGMRTAIKHVFGTNVIMRRKVISKLSDQTIVNLHREVEAELERRQP